MAVDLSAKYTKDTREFDGLVSIEKELIQEAMDGTPARHVVVMLVEVTALTVNVKDGTRTPRVTTVAAEVLDGDEAKEARSALDRQYRRRTGRAEAAQDTIFDAATEEPWPGDTDYDTAPSTEDTAVAEPEATPSASGRRRR